MRSCLNKRSESISNCHIPPYAVYVLSKIINTKRVLDTFLLLVDLTRSGATAAASCLLYHQHRALCCASISQLAFCLSTAAACPMPQQQPMPATLITAIRKVSTISQYDPTNKNPHGNCANFAYHEIIKHPSARRKIYIKEIMPAARAVTL